MKKLAYTLILVAALMMCLTVSAFAAGEPEAPFAPAAAEGDVFSEPVEPAANDVTTGEEAPPVQDGAVTGAPGETPVPEGRPDGWYGKDGVWYYYQGGQPVLSDWVTVAGERYFLDCHRPL